MGTRLFNHRIAILFLFPLSLALVQIAMGAAGSVQELANWSPFFCPLKKFLGLQCPTCGLTRSLLSAWSLELGIAWRYHPGGPIIFALTAVWSLLALTNQLPLLERRFLLKLKQLRSHPRWTLWVYALTLAYMAWGALRQPLSG